MSAMGEVQDNLLGVSREYHHDRPSERGRRLPSKVAVRVGTVRLCGASVLWKLTLMAGTGVLMPTSFSFVLLSVATCGEQPQSEIDSPTSHLNVVLRDDQ